MHTHSKAEVVSDMTRQGKEGRFEGHKIDPFVDLAAMTKKVSFHSPPPPHHCLEGRNDDIQVSSAMLLLPQTLYLNNHPMILIYFVVIFIWNLFYYCSCLSSFLAY